MTLVGTVWKPIGPSPIARGRQDNGLVSAIAINPNDLTSSSSGPPAAACGGREDGGLNWTPLFDRQIALGIGEPAAIAIDPNDTDTIYVGTSGRGRPPQAPGRAVQVDRRRRELRPRSGSGYPAGNIGNASQFVNQWINVIIVDPANSQTRLSGVDERRLPLDRRRAELDAGRRASAATRARSCSTRPRRPAHAILYAGMAGSGVFRSDRRRPELDADPERGDAAVAAALGAAPARHRQGRRRPRAADVAARTAAGDPGAVRVDGRRQRDAPDPVGVFLSTDQGANWTQRAATGMPGNTQGGYSFHMAVDPASPGDGANDIIYFGAVGQARSTNSGRDLHRARRPARRHARVGVRPAAGARRRRSSTAATTAASSARPTTARPGHRAERRRPADRAVLQHRPSSPTRPRA